MSDTKTLTKLDLRQFTGSEHWYRHGLNRKVLFTDGAKYVADQGGAYWLLDEIALVAALRQGRCRRGVSGVETESRVDRHTATLTCENGNGTTVFTKAIEFTDFPLPEITLWFHEQHHLPAERVLSKTGLPAGAAPFFIHHPQTGV